jgi:hypothetical protein
MEAVHSFELLVTTCKTTRHYTPKAAIFIDAAVRNSTSQFIIDSGWTFMKEGVGHLKGRTVDNKEHCTRCCVSGNQHAGFHCVNGLNVLSHSIAEPSNRQLQHLVILHNTEKWQSGTTVYRRSVQGCRVWSPPLVIISEAARIKNTVELRQSEFPKIRINLQ